MLSFYNFIFGTLCSLILIQLSIKTDNLINEKNYQLIIEISKAVLSLIGGVISTFIVNYFIYKSKKQKNGK